MKSNDMKRLFIPLTILLSTLLFSCTNNHFNPENPSGENLVTLNAVIGQPDTKVLFTDNEESGEDLKIITTWAAPTDYAESFMMYRAGTDSSRFTLTGRSDSNKKGSFSGTLPNGQGDASTYTVFYPADKATSDMSQNFITSIGQVQSANNPTGHLTDFNFMTGTMPLTGESTITFSHQMAIFKFVVNLQGAGIPVSLTLSSNNSAEFYIVKSIDSDNSSSIDIKSKHLTMHFEDYEEAVSSVTAYLMVIPTQLASVPLDISVIYRSGDANYSVSYSAPSVSKEYLAGYVYSSELNPESISPDNVLDDNTTMAESFEKGGGNDSSPYIISNASEFLLFINGVNGTEGKTSSDFNTKNYKLATNLQIDLDEWIPIGNSDNPFLGSFDGGGYTISGKMISGTSVTGTLNFGLFGKIGYVEHDGISWESDGREKAIHNLHIATDIIIPESTGATREAIGAFAGYSYGTVFANCIFSGSIASFSEFSSGVSATGGVVGEAYSTTIISCQNSGSITVNSDSDCDYNTGGIVGRLMVLLDIPNSISNSVNTGSISNGKYVGGLAGSSNGEIHTSHNRGNISSSTYNNLTGALVGENLGGLAKCCTNSGSPSNLTGRGALIDCSSYHN